MYELRRSRTNCDYSPKGWKWASGVWTRHERSLSSRYGRERKRKKQLRKLSGLHSSKVSSEKESVLLPFLFNDVVVDLLLFLLYLSLDFVYQAFDEIAGLFAASAILDLNLSFLVGAVTKSDADR